MDNNQNQITNQNLINQQNSSDNSQNLMNTKTKITIKIFITLLFYIALLSLSIFLIFNYYQINANSKWIYMNFKDAILMVLMVGVIGVFPLFGGNVTLFFFPFAPAVASLLVIFSIVSILEKWKIITNHKKIFLIIFTLIIISLISIKIFGTIEQTQYEKQATEERNYYEQTYETQKPLESKSLFIYPIDNEIVVSDIYGNNKKKIYSYSKKDIGYISPNGKYFVNCEPHDKYKNCHSLLSIDNLSQKIDLCIMKSLDHHKVCPEFCNWDSSGNSFVCKYKFYGFVDKNNDKIPSNKNVLILFNPQDGKHKIITQRKKNDKYIQDFAFINKDTIIFIDQNKFYKAENLHSCQTKISAIENLSECNNFIFENNNIYCPVSSEDYNIEIKDKDNFWVKGNNYFIIKQNLEQSSKKDYSVINKAPVSKTEMLFKIDDRFIFITQTFGEIKILDTETGRIRNMGGNLIWNKKIESDNKLIFKKYRAFMDIKKFPKSYLESKSTQENIAIQECKTSENAPSKFIK